MLTVTVTNPTTAAAPRTSSSMQPPRAAHRPVARARRDRCRRCSRGDARRATLAARRPRRTAISTANSSISMSTPRCSRCPSRARSSRPHSRIVPSELDLGTACVGTQVSGTVMLINDGTATLAGRAAADGQELPRVEPAWDDVSRCRCRRDVLDQRDGDARDERDRTDRGHADLARRRADDSQVPVKLDYVIVGHRAVSAPRSTSAAIAVDAAAFPQHVTLENCDLATTKITIKAITTNEGAGRRLGARASPRLREDAAAHDKQGSPSRSARPRAAATRPTSRSRRRGPQHDSSLGDATGRDFDDTSFYACACRAGRPSRGWPILLARLRDIVRRRRGSSSAR